MKFITKTYLRYVLLNCITLSAHAEIAAIDVDYKAADKTLLIKQCFDHAPAYAYAPDDQTDTAIRNFNWQNKPFNLSHGYVNLPVGKSGCLRYEIHQKEVASKDRSRRFKDQQPNGLLLSIDALLWQMSDQKSRKLPLITIRHDEYSQVSAPWQLISRSKNQTIFQVKPTPKYADGFVAIGPMEISDVYLGASRLRLAIMHGKHMQKLSLIEEWIRQMAGSVAKVGETFPLKDIQVLVIMMSGSGGVVPWGQVNRAGGQGVLLVVNPNHSKDKLFSDWTAAHEFSHLLMPYTPNDRWLSEGFASYHQNVSRLRFGLLDEAAAWSKLVAGFERGKKSASKRLAPNLKHAGRKNNMQMYWGGAVIALMADVKLQQQSQGRMSLSSALTELQDCCLDTGKSWAASSLFKELDSITETKVFTNLYEQEVSRKPYPEYQEILKGLGVRKNYSGKVVFNNEAPMAYIRKNISGG